MAWKELKQLTTTDAYQNGWTGIEECFFSQGGHQFSIYNPQIPFSRIYKRAL